MRRFFIWSALALLIGVLVAGGGYWAYWHFHARFQPVTITRNQAEIQRLLDEASWLSAGGGGEPLYMITYRDSASGQRFELEEFPKLRAAGVEPRVIVFARRDREGLAQSTAAERATVAELWISRDWALYQRWTATPARNWTATGIPSADNTIARAAVVDASRDFVTRLEQLLRGAGVPTGYPLVIWRDREGFLKACACTDARSWVFIRDDLDAPDRVREAGVEGGSAPLPAPEFDLPPGQGEAPARTLPEQRFEDGALPEVTPGESSARPAPPATPAPSAPRTPRTAPQPRQDDETVFF
ncbi:MAG: hypothetical protein ACK4E3_08190 [Brevundimonas sp.]|jgi:hypothetical protein|uniref:hypothetical protein n=1 Tax=Brevundimonas sp. TaxID=1871086 RepID=UPI00391AB35D